MPISKIPGVGIETGGVAQTNLAAGAVAPSNLSTGGPSWDSSGNVLVGTSSALGTLTVNGNIAPVQAPASNWGVDFAPSGSSGTFVTIANNGTYDIASGSGMVWMMEESGASGFCQIACWYGSTAVVWQSASGYSVTVNTASKINIYFVPTTPNKYRIQNTTGSSKSIWVTTIKMRQSV